MQDKHAKAENNPIATAGGFQPNGIATAEGFQPNGIATDTAFHSILSTSMFEKQAQVTPYQNAPDVYLRSGDPSRISRPTTPVSLPWSPTPQDSPRTPARSSVAGHSEQGSHLPQYKNDMLDDGSRLKTLDGKWVEASSVELLIRQATPAIGQCILVTHATSDDVGCLITLKSAPGISGLALDLAGLNLANKCGSEAATIMSARSCAVFRRGLAHELENVNAKLIPLSVQVRRFQVLREFFTVDNGLLLPDLTPNRVAITNRYRHLIDDMFQHETHFPHKWMQQPNDENIIIRAESSENDVHRNYSMLHPREPSPRRCPSPGSTTSFSKRQPSPRKSRHPSPLRSDQAHLSSLPPPPGLPLDLDGIVGSANNTPRIDRGRCVWTVFNHLLLSLSLSYSAWRSLRGRLVTFAEWLVYCVFVSGTRQRLLHYKPACFHTTESRQVLVA